MEGEFVSRILPWTPLYVGMLAVAVAAWRVLPGVMERINERSRDRASIEAAQFERMDARLQRLEASEERCRADLAQAAHRIAELEGYMMGQGQARQEAANIVAVERLADKNGENGK